jgi:hypothetical protein
MFYLAEQLLVPWLLIALATGFMVAWVSCGPDKSRD